MHESFFTKNNDGVEMASDFRSVGLVRPDFRIPGGVEMGENNGEFRLVINPSVDARSHAILEREFYAYHPDDRKEVIDDYAQFFPTALFVPDRHLFLIVGGKPKFSLVADVPPIMNKKSILQDDPNVVGFHSNMFGGDDQKDPFFEYYIAQEETSFVQENAQVMALVAVGIRLATNDFASINEEIKRLVSSSQANETRIRDLIDPYMRIQLRAIPNQNGSDSGGEGISTSRPTPPVSPDGQVASIKEDIL